MSNQRSLPNPLIHDQSTSHQEDIAAFYPGNQKAVSFIHTSPINFTTTNQPDIAAFYAVYQKNSKQIDHTTTKPQKHCANLHFEVHVSTVPVVDANVAIFASSQEQGAVAGFGEAVHCLCGHGSFHHLPQAAFQPRVHNVFIHQQIVAHLCTPTVAQVAGLPRRKDCCMQLNTLKLKS